MSGQVCVHHISTNRKLVHQIQCWGVHIIIACVSLNVVLDPRVVHDLGQRQPLTRHLPQQPRDHVLGLGAHVVGELDVHLGDPLVSLVVGLSLEWRLANKELVR